MKSASGRDKRHRPTAEELDERLVVPLDTTELVEGLLQAGPHPEGDGPEEIVDAARQESEYPGDETDEG